MEREPPAREITEMDARHLAEHWWPSLVRWPEDAERRRKLRALSLPALLSVADGCAPPAVDIAEDWTRRSAPAADVHARLLNLGRRFRATVRLDGSVLLTPYEKVVLSPLQNVVLSEILRGDDWSATRMILLAMLRAPQHGVASYRRLQDVLGRLRARLQDGGLTIWSEPGQRLALGLRDDGSDTVVVE